jgi:hypothetical protein
VYWITDRGPNQDCEVNGVDWWGTQFAGQYPPRDKGKGFPLIKYAPTFGEVDLTSTSESVKMNWMYPLRYQKIRENYGLYASGKGTKAAYLPYLTSTTTGGDDPANSGDCLALLPGFDPAGLDLEDVQPLKNNQFIASDEYGKVVIFDKTGTILMTYVAVGQGSLFTEANTGSPVKEVLPASFALRRPNRGMESLAVSANKSVAYTCLQSGMDAGLSSGTQRKNIGGGVSSIRNSRVIRCAVLDITDPLNARLLAEKYFFSSAAWRFPSADQKDLKLSAAYWLTDDKVMFLERESGQVSFHEVDFATGSNLQNSP